MRTIRRHKFFRLWLAVTLVFLLGTGLALRPDRDAAQYWTHQSVGIDVSDITARQAVTHIRLLQGRGLSLDLVRRELLSSSALTDTVLTELIQLHAALAAKDHAKAQLTLFASIALIPPLLLLELGVALIWTRRGFRAWTNGPWKMVASRNVWSAVRA
jgi:hypothetical protein